VRSSQNAKILRHFHKVRNELTPLQGLKLYGTMRLAARILELRKQGFAIKTTIKKTKNGARIAAYSLAPGSVWTLRNLPG
jgi:hypothetical protein